MKQARQQSLFPSLAVPKPALRPVARRVPRAAYVRRRAPLWLIVHLPQLALEALLRGLPASTPRAVIDIDGSTPRVAAVDALAGAGGITPGITLAAAWALLPHLEVHERDRARERDLLQRLAAWAGRYTPTVCIDDSALLLEVRGSLQLFGGGAALGDQVRMGLRQFGISAQVALAPTPRAALWLAKAGHEVHIDQPETLPTMLGELPLSVTGMTPDLLEKLDGIGARCVRDVMRLPRDGFARRYGARVLREIDQALGRTADVRRPLPPPRRFAARLDLLHEITETERLLHPARQLLLELEGYLHATQQGVSRVRYRLFHRDGSCTEVPLGFAEATRDLDRLQDLTEQRFESVVLPAPVLELELQACELVLQAGRDAALFVEQRTEDDWPQLIERLTTRLGEAAIRGLAQHDDHRPERAFRFVPAGTAGDAAGCEGRPCWLLETPRALRVRNGKPCNDAVLELLDGPERIESGWWDDNDVARDYYVARDAHGRSVWIFQDVKTGRWWLHGYFG